MDSLNLLTRDDIAPVIWAAIAIAYALASMVFFRSLRGRQLTRRTAFFDALLEGLRSGTLDSFEDLVNLYKGVMQLSSEDLSYRAGLSRHLREFLVKLHSPKPAASGSWDGQAEWKARVSNWLNENDSQAPYADLPAVERSLVSDMSRFLRADDRPSVVRKLGELASAIQVREEEFNRLRDLNRWSVPLAAIGLVLTVIFGLISVFK